MRLYARAECARTLREKDQRTCWDSAFGVEESQHVVVSELDTSKYLTQFFDGHRVQFFEIGHVAASSGIYSYYILILEKRTVPFLLAY